MPDRDHSPPRSEPDSPSTPPSPNELQHRTWVAQADELARLRDEVRAAAEHEAMEVVATARRNIRQVIADARRDLLVLAAQLHATLGPPGAPPPPGAPFPTGALGDPIDRPDSAAGPRSTWMADADQHAAVQAALERARAGIDALAQELEHVQLPADAPRHAAEPHLSQSGATDDAAAVRGVPWRPQGELVPEADAPAGRPPRQTNRLMAFVAAAAFLFVAGLGWWWAGTSRADRQIEVRSAVQQPPSSDPALAGAEPSAATRPASGAATGPAAAGTGSAGAQAANGAGGAADGTLSIVLDVQRTAWMRATIDGRQEAGRTYEPGERRRIDNAREVALRVGDAGAVTVSVNGSAPEPLGPDGAVVNRQYSADAEASIGTGTRAPAQPQLPGTAAPGGRQAPEGGIVSSGPAPDGAAGRGSPAVVPQASAGVPEAQLMAAGQQWLEAYHRQDSAGMARAGARVAIADERLPSERFGAGTPGVVRQFDADHLDVAGETAVYTARMIERAADGTGREQVSRVALIWARRDDRWHLTDVRLLSDARLGQIVR